MAIHSSILAWRIPWTEEPGGLQSIGSQAVGHALEKELATHSSVLAWRIPGTGSLVGCHLWGRTQGTLKSLLQHHSSKASILWHSAFFMVQLSHPYMTTGKTIALTRRTFVGKVMSLLFNMLSRLVITFLARSKHLLISWLQSPSAVILEPPKIKSATVSTVSPSICHEVMVPGCSLHCTLEILSWRNAGLDEAQAGIKIAGIQNHCRC